MPLDPFEITGSLAIGTGLGGAIKDTVDPRLQKFKNDQWSKHQHVPLSAATAAEIAAEDVAKYDPMAAEATLTGFEGARFAELYGVTLNAPGMGELLAMLRRSDEVNIDFTHGLRKAKLETRWDDALHNLRDVRIPGPDLAYMVVRGVVPDGGTLPSSLPTTADNLQLPPQLSIDTLLEARRTGWDEKRFAGLVARSGLAMAPGLAAQARFRKILTQNDYELTIARGDLFPAYAAPMLEVSRQILTAGEYAELQLRGYYDRATRLDNTRKHGMTDADSDWLYDVQGRGMSLHSAFIADRRGGVFRGPTDAIPDWAMFQLQRGNLRPEVYNLEWAQRHTYPSPFVIRGLLTGGAIDPAKGEELYLHIGWPSDLARQVATFYGKSTAAAADAHVTKAQNQLWTTTHRSYVAEEIDNPTATTAIEAAGVTAASAPAVLALWARERTLVRKQLSPAQIKKAVREGVTNPATGQPWTHAEGIAALLARGYDQADATTLLEL